MKEKGNNKKFPHLFKYIKWNKQHGKTVHREKVIMLSQEVSVLSRGVYS